MLDDFLPHYDVRSQNSIVINSTPARVYEALQAADFSRVVASERAKSRADYCDDAQGR